LLLVLVFLGVFGMASDGRHIDIDLRTRPAARWIAGVGAGGLVVGTTAAYLAHSAFPSRYASIVFPFFGLAVAHGCAGVRHVRVRAGVRAGVVALGLVGSVRNVVTDRTEATKVAAILRADAKPGDVVLYCPDQVGPAVHRLAPRGLDEMTYPLLRAPEL